MKSKATIRLKFLTEQQAETMLRSLKPEADHSTITRSQISLQKKGRHLTLKIEAKDTVALRATLNAYLRWANSLLNVFKVLDSQ